MVELSESFLVGIKTVWLNSHASASIENVAILAQVWFILFSFKPICSRSRHPFTCLLLVALFLF